MQTGAYFGWDGSDAVMNALVTLQAFIVAPMCQLFVKCFISYHMSTSWDIPIFLEQPA